MKSRDIRDLVHFGDDEPRHDMLFESDRLWSQIVCLQGAQGLGPVSDGNADALVAVLSGEVAVQVGRDRTRMKQWGSVLVPAGNELTIRNASAEPTVVLLVTAPPPEPAQ